MKCSVRQSTKEVYGRHWSLIVDWCNRRGVDPCSVPVSQICAFLQSLLNKGSAYRTIAVYRSAISKYHISLDGKPAGQNLRVCRFLKGVFVMRPLVRSLVPSWDLDVVLEGLQKEQFEHLKKSSRKVCTFKTVLLLALATARRSSEIAAIGRVEPYLRYEAGGVRLRTVPELLSKTSTPFYLGQDMFLADLRKENKKLCV